MVPAALWDQKHKCFSVAGGRQHFRDAYFPWRLGWGGWHGNRRENPQGLLHREKPHFSIGPRGEICFFPTELVTVIDCFADQNSQLRFPSPIKAVGLCSQVFIENLISAHSLAEDSLRSGYGVIFQSPAVQAMSRPETVVIWSRVPSDTYLPLSPKWLGTRDRSHEPSQIMP